MDPNANMRERIALLKQDAPLSRHDRDRLQDLENAYVNWRAMGGFAADELLCHNERNARRLRAARNVYGPHGAFKS